MDGDLSLWPYLAPTVEVPADLADQSPGGLSVSVASEATVPSSKLTWDLLPSPGGDRVHIQTQLGATGSHLNNPVNGNCRAGQ